MPAGVGVGGSDDALGEDEVDEEEQDHSGGDEDVGRDGYPDIVGVDGPYDAQNHGDQSRHAEAEHHS